MGRPSRRFDLVEKWSRTRVLYLIKHFVIKCRLSTVHSVINELRMSANRNGAIIVPAVLRRQNSQGGAEYGRRCAAYVQLMRYLTSFDLLPSLQSGFRPGHSITAVLRVLSDILLAADCGDVSALVLLDMTAASDTILLQLTFGIGDTVHRKQQVWRGSSRSSTTYIVCGVPQGSVLGPILSSTL